jgi:hypothetical protein
MIVGSGAFSYLTYASANKNKRNIYAVAGVPTIGIGLFSRISMASGIERLIEISKDGTAQSQAQNNGEALRLLKTWVAQNWVRTCMSFAAGMLGLVAALDA